MILNNEHSVRGETLKATVILSSTIHSSRLDLIIANSPNEYLNLILLDVRRHINKQLLADGWDYNSIIKTNKTLIAVLNYNGWKYTCTWA